MQITLNPRISANDENQHSNLSKSFALYKNTAQTTFPIPRKYNIFNWVPKSTMLKTPVSTTDIAVAYPFSTASANFSTAGVQ